MKSLFIAFCLITVVTATSVQSFECVCTNITSKVITIECDTRNRSQACAPDSTEANCTHTILDIPKEHWSVFEPWSYSNGDDYSKPPVKQMWPVLGQVFVARYEDASGGDSEFVPLEPCSVRHYHAIVNFCRDYCRPPVGALQPADCRGPRSVFIQQRIAAATSHQGWEKR